MVLEILEAEPALVELLDDEIGGTDYWMLFDGPSSEVVNGRGERLASVVIVFRAPFSLNGNVPTFSDPCNGVGDEGEVPDDHPCRNDPRMYTSIAVDWRFESRELHVVIDLERQAVVDVFNPGIAGESVDDLIAILDEHYDGSY